MDQPPSKLRYAWCCFGLMFVVAHSGALAQERESRADYLSLANGAVPVAVEPAGSALKVGIEQALLAVDGDSRPYLLTPKPGNAASRVVFVYRLPAPTTFTEFSVPNVLETPSPSQTFVARVTVAGSAVGPQGPYQPLGSIALQTHPRKGQASTFAATRELPVRWLRLTLEGGLDLQRDKTFLEFSEIVGHGRQDAVPRSTRLDGKWKGRGVLLELHQSGARVAGCYDGLGDLEGTVSGNVLQATGKTRSGGIPSTFVLAVDDAGGVLGVRSTNGAPFRLYAGQSAPGAATKCTKPKPASIGCGSIVHGLRFDFDSDRIRPESAEVLDALYTGLRSVPSATITLVGHTSSEGSASYNEELSRRRAESVAVAMRARGIDAKRIGAEGRGEKQPIADNASEAGRSLNRRVEIRCSG